MGVSALGQGWAVGEARVGKVSTIRVRNDCEVKRVQGCRCVCSQGRENNTTPVAVVERRTTAAAAEGAHKQRLSVLEARRACVDGGATTLPLLLDPPPAAEINKSRSLF
jgi:hypothetical protein